MRLLWAAVRLALVLALVGGAQIAVAHAGRSGQAPPLAEPFDADAIDRHANACTNFFAYANGRFLRAHPIPSAYTEYGYIEQLEDRTRDTIRAILERAQTAGGTGNTQRIGAFYHSCMDTAAIERRGLEPIAVELARIDALDGPAALTAELARLHAVGVDAAFGVGPTQDARNTSRTVAEFDQGGIGLPERDYYLRADAESRTLRGQYEHHVMRMLALAGDRAAAADARTVIAFESTLARASRPVADLRDPLATYHPFSFAQVMRLTPRLGVRRYLQASGIPPSGTFNVAEPDFMRAVDRAVADTPLETWRRYLRWRVIDTFAPQLPERFARESFAFRGTILNGAKTQLPRWKRCVISTDTELGWAVGEAYVAQAFPPAAKARARELTLRIKAAYGSEMQSLAWMTPATKRVALGKLAAMGTKVGYPQTWRDYRGYSAAPDTYLANVQRATAFNRRFDLRLIGRPVNRSLWFMTPQTVNAYNDQQRNEIVLPAAQLQRPFFDPAADDAANLGATGAGTIGHEMTHGFDDEGHKLDAQGNLRDWWTARDVAQFNARANCVIRQFDRTVAVGNVHYQGRLVAGEAIADLGGVVIGYHALETEPARSALQTVGGFTPEQRYFLAYAQSWAENIRPQAARAEALSDPHPLPRDRVNVTLSNVSAWYAAFGCPKPPRPVCAVW